jgi:hypothetical protein
MCSRVRSREIADDPGRQNPLHDSDRRTNRRLGTALFREPRGLVLRCRGGWSCSPLYCSKSCEATPGLGVRHYPTVVTETAHKMKTACQTKSQAKMTFTFSHSPSRSAKTRSSTVGSQLRHSDPRITLGLYTHVVPQSQRDAVAGLASAISSGQLLTQA